MREHWQPQRVRASVEGYSISKITVFVSTFHPSRTSPLSFISGRTTCTPSSPCVTHPHLAAGRPATRTRRKRGRSWTVGKKKKKKAAEAEAGVSERLGITPGGPLQRVSEGANLSPPTFAAANDLPTSLMIEPLCAEVAPIGQATATTRQPTRAMPCDKKKELRLHHSFIHVRVVRTPLSNKQSEASARDVALRRRN